jgi:DHA1 family multidrug resistance protein-like MFS transporter
MTTAALTHQRRNEYVATAMVFVVFTGFAFVIPFLPLFVRELGVSDDARVAVWSGVLIGVTPLLAGLLAPAWGRVADRHGPKRIVVAALFVSVGALLLSALVRNVWELLALRATIGLTGGIGPLGLSMATAGAPREHTGRAVGLIQSAQILAAAVGPLTGGLLADGVGMRSTFLYTAVACALALLLVQWFYVEAPRGATHGQAVPGRRLFELLALPHVPVLLATLFIVNFVGRSMTPILPLQLQGLGVPTGRLAGATGTVISCYSLAAAASASAFGRATRRFSARTLLFISLAGGAAAVLPMASAPSYAAMLLLAVALGLTSGGALTLCYTIGGLLVPASVRSTALGLFSSAALSGGAVAPWVAGELVRFALLTIYPVNAILFVVLALALGVALPAVAPTGRPAPVAPSPEG